MTAPVGWPRAAVVTGLAVTAGIVAAQELYLPSWTAHVAPAVLGATTLVVGRLVLRHGRNLPAPVATSWRSFGVIAGLLGGGQVLRAVAGDGANPTGAGLPDLALAATGPVTVLLCLRLIRSARGRLRHQTVLDALVALAALTVLLEVLLPVTAGSTGGPGALLITVGYPVISAALCAVGLVTVATVSPPRRRAAGWLLLCFSALAVAMVSGALAVGHPGPGLDAVTTTGYLTMLAAATLALAADPGPQARADGPTAAVPLVGVVVSFCLAFAAVVLLLGGWALGRPMIALEAGTVGLVMLLTFGRALVWAVDGARLTRRMLRTEAYFRALVHRSADVTVVLDDQGEITWVTGADRTLEGRRLDALVHPEDRDRLSRALAPSGPADELGAVLRLRGRDGGWRRYEVARGAAPTGLPVNGVVLHLRDVSDRPSSELELERLAYTDYLTGLPNRARFMAALESAAERATEGEAACVLLVDLDGFKIVNDAAGHEAGDQLLCEVADLLRSGARDGDLVARLGGDEFALLVSGLRGEATELAERLVILLNRTFRPAVPGGEGPGPVFAVSGSIGVCRLRAGEEAVAAIRQADLALRAAKAAGKSCVRSSRKTIDSAMGRRARLAADLPAALAEGQLRLLYQPVVGVTDRRVLGLEALVRWQHPVLGTVPPDEFISLAEDDGLIVPLQQWVLRTATADLAGLLSAGYELQLGVNVSVRHLQAGCLAPDVARALAASAVPPGNLVLEITESVLLDNEDRLASDFGILREMGCVLALDDFGRGWSSLAYLARLPVDILKMDREFVAEIERDSRGAALVAGVIELGRSLGMDVVAEGVETPGQAALLQDMACRYLQGYLFGRPMPLDELRAALAAFDPGVLDVRRPTQVDVLSTS
jgi:diguanylate cyclase (GGDEF)-like protein